MTVAAMSHQGLLSIACDGLTPEVVATPMTFVSSTLASRSTILERQGMRGTRSHDIDDTRFGPVPVSGTIVFEPSPTELMILLRMALGAGIATTGIVAEILPECIIVVDKVTNIFTYAGCKINRLTLTGSQGGILTATVDVVGKAESDAGAIIEPTSSNPYVFSDLVLTLASSARETFDFELIIDNALITDRFADTTVVTDLPEGDRIVTLRTTHAFVAANEDLLAQALAGATGTLVLNDGVVTTTITFGKLQVPPSSPEVPNRSEIQTILDMVARKDDSTMEIAVAVT